MLLKLNSSFWFLAGLKKKFVPKVWSFNWGNSEKLSLFASYNPRFLLFTNKLIPKFRSSLTNEAFPVRRWSVVFPLMLWSVLVKLKVFPSGILVITFTVPPIALEPYSAETPPRTTSMRSIMLVGICSIPYNPIKGLNIGRLLINIWEYPPWRPLILNCV